MEDKLGQVAEKGFEYNNKKTSSTLFGGVKVYI